MKALLLLPLLLILSVNVARASAITFEADYVTLINRTCPSHFGCITLPNVPFTKTFSLGSSQLAVDGVYDVVASLDPSPIFAPPPDSTFTISLVANAVVSDGQVIDLIIHFLETTERQVGFGTPFTTSSSFDALSGNWSRSTSSSDPFGLGGSSNASGTYTIRQLPAAVPEPDSLLLLSGGLAALLRVRRRL